MKQLPLPIIMTISRKFSSLLKPYHGTGMRAKPVTIARRYILHLSGSSPWKKKFPKSIRVKFNEGFKAIKAMSSIANRI